MRPPSLFLSLEYSTASVYGPTTSEQVFNHYPGSVAADDIIAFIVDDPNVVFEVQADDTFPVADLFGNFDVVDQSTTGDTRSGRSNGLDVTTGATTTTLPLKAIDIIRTPTTMT